MHNYARRPDYDPSRRCNPHNVNCPRLPKIRRPPESFSCNWPPEPSPSRWQPEPPSCRCPPEPVNRVLAMWVTTREESPQKITLNVLRKLTCAKEKRKKRIRKRKKKGNKQRFKFSTFKL